MLGNSLFYKHTFAFISVSLKGISQVILIENVVSGAIILLAISITSVPLGVIALLSSMIGTLIGRLGGADEAMLKQGLLGYNSVLTGLALFLFLTGSTHWIFSLVGAAIAAILTASFMHFMKNSGIPILTLPFIILTWFTLLVSYRFTAFHLSDSLVPQSLMQWELDITGEVDFTQGVFNGIGQVFFLDYTISGILLFIAVFWAEWRLGLAAFIGNAVALLTSLALGGEYSLIFLGLYGYNAILTNIAVSVVFNSKRHPFSFITGGIAACMTVPLAASINTWLLPYGLPALTMPFVLSTWVFLSARKILPRV
ncbi:urea transporter [Oceanobacillus arenosus]|uniref:Urea transporter n=1 Tax=Oceanobacillus arenosus TaxID=1229153 RepID=A0A3D8PK62_9BACI|nr:urea transporter [Oceanobacillus arenosus]RDW16434.1 urea transporter [Oceanobacillus arenosus]